jgi:hypothetical protein
MAEYRLKRMGPNNLAIERKRDGCPDSIIEHWTVIFWCGNNLKSVTRGLLEIVLMDYTPEDKNLLEAIKNLELELENGLERIEKIVKEIVNV